METCCELCQKVALLEIDQNSLRQRLLEISRQGEVKKKSAMSCVQTTRNEPKKVSRPKMETHSGSFKTWA